MGKTLTSNLKGKGLAVQNDNLDKNWDGIFPKCAGKDCQKLFCKCRDKKEGADGEGKK